MDYVYGIINQRVKKNQYTGGSTDTATVHIDNATNIITVDAQEQKEQVNADWNAIEGVAEILNKPSIKGLDNGSVLINDVLRNNASGSLSTAVGSRTSARGDYSFAEGYITVASGFGAHAEGAASLDFGKLVIASGAASHAEGMNTEASGLASHAEGMDTEASGEYAHADGQYTVARGRNSSASGLYTIANRASQKVFGEYNISDTSSGSFTTRGTYVEIVGNGTAINSRSNARTLDWNGNEVIAGKLTVGTNPTNDMDVATKQYVDGKAAYIVTATAVPSAQGITWTSDKTFAEIKAQIDNGNFNIIVQANVPAVTKYIFNLVSYSNTTIIFCYTPNPCDEQWLFFKSDGTITEVYDTVPRIPDTNLLTEGTYNLHATVQIAENVGNSYATLSWVKDTEITGTLTAGATTLTLTDSAITTSSIVEIYTDIYGVAPMSVTTTAGHITMIFIPQMTDLNVKVIIK